MKREIIRVEPLSTYLEKQRCCNRHLRACTKHF